MFIYILVIILILLLQYSLPEIISGSKYQNKEDYYMRLVCWILILLASLRGLSVGADTSGYWSDYLHVSQYSFNQLMDMYVDYPVYFLLSKLCSMLHLPIQVWFGFVEGLYVYAIYKFISRYSSDKLYSMLGFFVIGLFAFSMAGLKQTLSMAFVIWGYLALDDKKYLKALLWVVIAYYCHHASLVFLAGIALYYMRSWRNYYLYLVLIVMLLLLGTRFLWGQMLTLLENEHYSELYSKDEGYSTTTMMIYGVLLGILIIFSGRYRHFLPNDSKIMLGMSTLAFALQGFALISSSAFRLSFYFLPFMIVAFPNVFNFIVNKSTRQRVKIGVELLLIFIFLYTNRNGGGIVPYKFFWQ